MVDIIVVIMLLLGFFIGVKRGLFKQVMRFVGSILALLIAYVFAGSLSSVLSSFIPFPNLGDSPLLNILLTNGMIENAYYHAIAFFILFVIARIILVILTNVLNIAGRIPVLKQVNSLAGGVFGVVETYLIIFVILFIASYLPIETVQAQLQDSILTGFIVNNTPYISGKIQSLWI